MNTPVIVALRRSDGKKVYLSDPNSTAEEIEKQFLPFRLTRVHSEYEWAELQGIGDTRRERFDAPSATSAGEPKKSSPMNSIKKALKGAVAACLAFVALAFAPVANAQSSNLGYLGNGTTLNIAATSTNTTMSATNGMIYSVRGVSYTAVQPTFKLTGAGTSPCVFTFDTSVDGQAWASGAFTVSVTAAGTTKVANVSNQTTGGIRLIRLSGVTNPNSAAITNLTVACASPTNP